MKKTLITASVILCALIWIVKVNAQADKSKSQEKTVQNNKAQTSSVLPKVALKPDATPSEMAQAAILAHGGDKFRNMKSLVMRGTVDVTSSTFNQSFAGNFAIVFKDDKYRLQIQTPFVQFVQSFDGTETYSSVGNFRLPPINRLGFQLLQKNGVDKFKTEALPEGKKRGFRLVSPEGFATDFFLDEKTGQVKSYSSTYQFNNRSATTVVENDKFRDVSGVLLPERYAQRFESGGQIFYTDFKVKEILVDSEVADDIFANAQTD
jgi:hypothetical protein